MNGCNIDAEDPEERYRRAVAEAHAAKIRSRPTSTYSYNAQQTHAGMIAELDETQAIRPSTSAPTDAATREYPPPVPPKPALPGNMTSTAVPLVYTTKPIGFVQVHMYSI